MKNEGKAKELLQDYRYLNQEIDNEIERLESLEGKITAVSSPSMDGMPKSNNPLFDKMADSITKKIQLESTIKVLMEERDNKMKTIESLIRKLSKPNERAIIRMRYLDLEEWSKVLDMMFSTKVDYYEKYDSYKQRMFRVHKQALEKLDKMF